jgi:hypothetical protein
VRYLVVIILAVAVFAMAAIGGYYTASRLGDPAMGIAAGLGFIVIFSFVLWRALKGADAD